MLKLRRLELSGFKSFVDPVTLEVHGGMTAIVGPNGCGKSNIADAVVWALGERSAKSLRGERMEDVIFAGAKGRKPLGMAEVTLQLVSDNGFPTSQDGLITIGRRIYRTGEGQYFLNGKSVRLKDVKDLLMDTGLGIRAYSMIEQGKIGMILSGKPHERRLLLEEAAGITRYRERRRVAEIKLEEARANLERLDDVISEVQRAVRSLKRQANAAGRYNSRQDEYRSLLRQVLVGRWGLIQSHLAELRGQIDALVSREAELSATLHRQEAAHTQAREELERLSRDLADRHSRVADLAATIEGKQEFLKGSRHRLQEIAERMAAGEETDAHRQQQIVELEGSLEALVSRRSDLASERARAASDVDQDDARISQVEALVSQAEELVESLRSKLLGSINHLSAQRSRLHREQVEREKGELRRRHVQEELERKTAELEEAARSKSDVQSNLDELQASVQSAEKGIQQEQGELETVYKQREEIRQRLESLETERDRLQRRQQVLDELEEQQQERRARLREALEEAGLEHRPFLSDQFEVPEGWAASLDLFLGELEDAVLLEPEDDALGLAQSLAEGRATGRLLQPHGTSHFLHLRMDDPAVQSSLGEALGLPSEIAAVLPPAYLVDTPAAAQRLAQANPGVAFISRDRLWAQAGALHFHGAKAKPGHLARGRELTELQRQLPPLEGELAAARDEIDRLAGRAHEHEESVRLLEQKMAQKRELLAVAQARFDDASSRHHRLAAEKQTLTDEIAEIDRELERFSAQLDRLTREVEQEDSAHQDLERAFDSAQTEVDRARDDRESTRTSGASRRGRLEVLAERLESHDHEIARIRRQIDEHRQHLELWQAETERLNERQAAIEESMKLAESELQTALEKRELSQGTVISQQETLDEHRAKLREQESQVEETRTQRDELRSEISDIRVSEAGVRQDAEHLTTHFREEFQESPPTEGVEPVENLDELEIDLTRRKEVLDRMGPVNLLAAAEHDEQSERLEFLTTQRTDVADSVARLRETIREINATSSQRFKATFDEVNAHFSDTYVDLFRGGQAEMRLLDEQDPLETPIEIVARPPGKRLQNMMLLSGGEKALTAIALLFALFKTKPSPFCILDEVDAPLDDVNTLRFVELIKKMSDDTQFVLITHNKLTMEAANLLYGVTMQERGVSNLVSVELDAVQPEIESGRSIL